MRGSGYIEGTPTHTCSLPREDDAEGTLWRCDCGVLWYAGHLYWERALPWRPWLAWKYRHQPYPESTSFNDPSGEAGKEAPSD